MSLILDALNRSQGDTGQVPGLATEHYPNEAPRNPRRYQAWLVMALLVALLVIGWLLWERKLPATMAVDEIAQLVSDTPPEPVPPAVQRAARPAAARIEPLRVEPEQSSRGRASSDLVEPAPTAPDRMAPGGGVPVPVRPVQAGSGVAELYRQQQSSATAELKAASEPGPPASSEPAAKAVREEQHVDIEQLLVEARAELDDARLDEHEVPFLAALSQQTKDRIPTILYQRHDYSSKASKSSVVLNGKQLASGAGAAGLKVEEILPDSVVLSYQGISFRLRALNSWVNL